MSFTMKMLAVSVLVVAMMALTRGAAPQVTVPPPFPEETDQPIIADEKEDLMPPGTHPEGEDAEEPGSGSEEEEEEEGGGSEEGEHKVSKRAVRCPCGWSLFRGRCYRYFLRAKTWALAQRHCQQIGGNLASVLTRLEDNWLKRLAGSRSAWIGLSDAQQERVWLWAGCARPSRYTNWCRGQPDNRSHKQHCVHFNWSGRRCWDDDNCLVHKGYICTRH